MGTNEENNIENLVCFIYGGAGAGPLHRLRPKSTGSDRLLLRNTVFDNNRNGTYLFFYRKRYKSLKLKEERILIF